MYRLLFDSPIKETLAIEILNNEINVVIMEDDKKVVASYIVSIGIDPTTAPVEICGGGDRAITIDQDFD